MAITYILPGTLYYPASTGGTFMGYGSPFDPVGKPGGLTDTNTRGTYTYYAECSTTPGCRSSGDFVINSSPAQPADFTVSTNVICPPANGVVYTVPADPAVTYNWSYFPALV